MWKGEPIVPSFGDMYSVALLEGLGFQKGWMVNWPPQFSAELGDVGNLNRDPDTGLLSLAGSNKLSEFSIRAGQPQVGPKGGPRSFTSGSSTRVEFGTDAKLPGWQWIGNAKAGLHASFGQEGGMETEVSGPQHLRIPDLGGLKADLLRAAKSGALKVGQAVIVELERADSGLVLSSEEESGSLKATTNADVGPAGLSLTSFAVDISVKSKSGKALSLALPEPFTTAYRVLKIGTRGIWWWKKISIQGADRMSPEQVDDVTEALLEVDDYFARFDDDPLDGGSVVVLSGGDVRRGEGGGSDGSDHASGEGTGGQGSPGGGSSGENAPGDT